MDSRLQEAARYGHVESLLQLLKEDPLLLERIGCGPNFSTGNVLHTVALLGHVDFASELLNRRPELVLMKDERGSYPLQLASTRGHVEVVKKMLSVMDSASLCSLKDKDGRTALHLAAANGRVDVMRELVKVNRELVRAVSGRGETALHLCLQYNQLEAAELLLEADVELVNVRDGRDNTVLHLATARKHFQMLELFITKTQLDINATNGYNCTALDVLMQSPSESGDLEIAEMLSRAGCERKQQQKPQAQTTIVRKPRSWKKKLVPSSWYQMQKKDEGWFREKHNSLLIVATLIATVTFAAGLNPPGGIWQDMPNTSSPTEKKFKPGTAIQNDYHPHSFKLFMYFDVSGLVSSLFIILFLVSGLPLKNKVTTSILVFTIWVAVTSVTVAFVFGTRLIVVSEKISQKLIWVLVGWMGLMAVLVFWYCIVILFHLLHFVQKMNTLWLWAKQRVGSMQRSEEVCGDHLLDDQRDAESGQCSGVRKECVSKLQSP